MFIRIPSEIAEIFCRKSIRLPWLSSTISLQSTRRPRRYFSGGRIFAPVPFEIDFCEQPDPPERGGRVRFPMSFAFLDSER